MRNSIVPWVALALALNLSSSPSMATQDAVCTPPSSRSIPLPTTDKPSIMPARSRTPFGYFLFIIAAYGLLGSLVGMFLPLYFREIGFSGVQTGLYYSALTIAAIVFQLPMGVSSDRRSLPFLVMLGFFLMGLRFIGFLASESFWIFCIFAAFASFGRQLYGVASSTMFFKISGPNNEREAGLYQLVKFFFMGVGMLIGGLVIAKFSFRLVFQCSVAGYGLLLVLAWFLPRTEKVVIKINEYKREVLTPQVLYLTAIFFLSSTHWGAEMVAYTPFLKYDLELSLKHIGYYTSTTFMILGVGAYGASLALQRKWVGSLKNLMVIGFLLSGVFHVLMCVRIPWLSYIFRAFHEIGDGIIFIAYYHGVASIFKLDRIGGCAAFISLCMSAGCMVTAPLFGHIGDLYGHQWPLIISGVMLVMLAGLLKLCTASALR